MRGAMLRLAVFLACIGFAHAQMPMSQAAYTPSPSGGGNTCSSPGPIDAVADTPVVAVGLRVLKESYAANAAINVSTNSGVSYADVGFTNCDLTTSGLTLCVSANVCPVKTFYDQIASGCNPTQATVADQAYLLLNQQNGLPTIIFNGSSDTYACTLGSGVTTNTVFVVAAFNSVGNSGTLETIANSGVVGTSVGCYSSCGFQGVSKYDGTTSSYAHTATNLNDGTYRQWTGDETNTLSRFIVNGASNLDETTAVTIPSATTFTMGSEAAAAGDFGLFRLGELAIFQHITGCTAGSGDCNTVYLNQKAYWGTP